MSRSTLRALAAYAGGALEPGELARFEERLAADPELARRAADLRVSTARPEPTPLWSLPPPGLYGGPVPFGARLEQAMSMGAEQAEIALTRVRFQAPDAEIRAVVLMLRGRGGWRVLFPEPTEPPLHVHELSALPTGERELQLAALPADLRALALALPHPGLLPRQPTDPDPWAALRRAIDDDLVPVRTLALTEGGVFSG